MSDLIYLASPYSHKDPAVQEARFQSVCKIAARLMGQGTYIYSPIAHTHPIALAGSLPGHWEFWAGFDHIMIKCCQKLLVAKIEGWETSRGVAAEVKIAQELGIPVDYIDP